VGVFQGSIHPRRGEAIAVSHCGRWTDQAQLRALVELVLGQCPGNDQSAGRRRSGKTRKGSKWLDWALEEAAMAAIRTNDSYLAAQYARLRPRRGHKKALGAVKHSLICICWHMLSTGELYTDLGGDYFRKRDPERITKRLIAQLESLGHKVTLQEMPQAA
jgi:hypothetical protein